MQMLMTRQRAWRRSRVVDHVPIRAMMIIPVHGFLIDETYDCDYDNDLYYSTVHILRNHDNHHHHHNHTSVFTRQPVNRIDPATGAAIEDGIPYDCNPDNRQAVTRSDISQIPYQRQKCQKFQICHPINDEEMVKPHCLKVDGGKEKKRNRKIARGRMTGILFWERN